MPKKYPFSSPQSSLEARAERLAILRNMAGLKLVELSKKYHMGYTTVREWENGTRILSSRGAKIIVEAMKQEGIDCALSWLLHGSGNAPTFINQKSDIFSPNVPMLEQEMALFRSGRLNAITLHIKDDAMYPFLAIGDQVGGICLDRDEFKLLDAQYCIIESKTHGSICRWVQKIAHTDLFNCQCINLSTKLKNPVTLKMDEIIKAAPVIRFWKKERSK